VDVSIDVVIPSFRLDENNLLPVLKLQATATERIIFYLVVDNPDATVPDSIQNMVDNHRIFLLVNDKNSGASFTRNRGIDTGNGEWILFLDDDLRVPDNLLKVYAGAIGAFPNEIGFIGLVQLPEPATDFSRAIAISGSMDIFSVATRRPSFVWGATANFMLRRSALQGNRFSMLYPKSGGGEDIDLFLRIREKNGYKNYRSLPEAKVYHPWWNSGKPDFRKSYRYGLGNSRLGELNPQYAYHDFLNCPETIIVSAPLLFILAIACPSWIPASLLFILGVLLIEFIASAIQTVKRSGTGNLRVIFYVFALRMVYETGLLWGNISRFRIIGIGERFHDDGKRNKFFFYRTNTHRIVKWILYPLLVYMLIRNYF
jgi:glycosyltransferase involved in cell wall biosynthesis